MLRDGNACNDTRAESIVLAHAPTSPLAIRKDACIVISRIELDKGRRPRCAHVLAAKVHAGQTRPEDAGRSNIEARGNGRCVGRLDVRVGYRRWVARAGAETECPGPVKYLHPATVVPRPERLRRRPGLRGSDGCQHANHDGGEGRTSHLRGEIAGNLSAKSLRLEVVFQAQSQESAQCTQVLPCAPTVRREGGRPLDSGQRRAA